MNTGRINLNRNNGEFYPNEITDYEWAREHRHDLLAQYGASIVLIYEKQVVGVGKTLQAAIDDAEKKLPDATPEITPIIELVGQRHPFFRIYPKPAGA
jgi:hypothetical protein